MPVLRSDTSVSSVSSTAALRPDDLVTLPVFCLVLLAMIDPADLC